MSATTAGLRKVCPATNRGCTAGPALTPPRRDLALSGALALQRDPHRSPLGTPNAPPSRSLQVKARRRRRVHAQSAEQVEARALVPQQRHPRGQRLVGRDIRPLGGRAPREPHRARRLGAVVIEQRDLPRKCVRRYSLASFPFTVSHTSVELHGAPPPLLRRRLEPRVRTRLGVACPSAAALLEEAGILGFLRTLGALVQRPNMRSLKRASAKVRQMPPRIWTCACAGRARAVVVAEKQLRDFGDAVVCAVLGPCCVVDVQARGPGRATALEHDRTGHWRTRRLALQAPSRRSRVRAGRVAVLRPRVEARVWHRGRHITRVNLSAHGIDSSPGLFEARGRPQHAP